MTGIPLEERAYWIGSPAYRSEQSAAGLTQFEQQPGIADMLLEVYSIKQRTLKAMN
jgi:hypothetical protein